jgi:hypothetical protein
METFILTCLQLQVLTTKINNKPFPSEVKTEIIRELKKTSLQECNIKRET